MSSTRKKKRAVINPPAPKPGNVVSINQEPSGASSIMTIIGNAALDPTFDVEKLNALLAVKERWEATEARKAYSAAMTAFKAENITINKDGKVAFGSGAGATAYTHATLGNVVGTLVPVLARYGFVHHWTNVQDFERGSVTVTCILTHELGHFEESSLTSGLDTSGGKNIIQALGSTKSYLERYTLLGVTGTATADQDDDAVAGGFSTIDDEQYAALVDLQKEVNADTARFLKHFKIETLDMLPADQYQNAVRALEAKKQATA